MVISVVLVIIGFLIYLWHKKTTFYKSRVGKKMVIGEFVKYKMVTEKVLRNEYHTTEYPFVRICQGIDDVGIFKLNFNNFLAKKFKEGEKIELFWSNNKLFYWNAYDIGVMKYFPKTGFFD